MLINKNSPHGADIYKNKVLYDFSANVNPFGLPEPVKQAIVRSLNEAQDYPDPYCTQLRNRLSLHEGVQEEHILCGNGAAELIYQFAYSLDRNKPALVVSPTFCEYEAALSAAGVKTERYKLRREDCFTLTQDVLYALDGYCAVFLCSPNNPTGITVGRELLYAITAKCSENGTRLFLDLCFADLSDEPDKYSVPQLIGMYPSVFVLKAFTKSYAIAGIRLGYGMSSDEQFLERMSERTQCWNVSSLAQHAGIAALYCTGYVEKSRAALLSERERMKAALRSLGVTVFDGEANYLLLQLRQDVYDELLQRGILVRSCANYPGMDETYIRIAIKRPSDNGLLLAAFKEILNK